MVGPTYQAKQRQSARLVARLSSRGVASALLLLGCQASINANGSQRIKAESEEGPEDAPDFNKPLGADALTSKSTVAPALANTTLLGARRDMSLVSEHASVACACVKVGLGSAQSAAFQWQGPAPRLNDDIQLAFAMTSENIACNNEPKGASGASYWGYRISGNDVIVFLEGVRAGRPRTTSAIIPKPVGDGRVYVAPATSRQPYGRPLLGKGGRCEVGNVSDKRSTPFTMGELGDTLVKDANGAPTVDVGE